MDVNRRSFQWQLPRMLRALASAHFVAIDLELSGIQSKSANRTRIGDGNHGSKQSLQQRYEEAKEAADKYQVLQVGLTCVVEDRDKGKYVARPYNFFLNPVLEEKLDIERIFSYQSGAVEFLLSHGFRMDAPFLEGVPYLSREEEALARELELSRLNKTSIADIQLKSDDTESITFVQRVREEVEVWKKRTTSYPDFINIAPVGHALGGFGDRGLNNYQKRLVHQIVRAEHPDLVTISRPGFIQIIAHDQKREDALKQTKMKAYEEKLARQIGLRWLVEAMVGGDLSTIDPLTFARAPNNEPFWIDLKEVTREFHELRDRLETNHTVLVGHNIFMDLINFYRCFFGHLPDRVEDFQSIMHQLFPMIIDTKYMATHNSAAVNARSGLEELNEEFSKLVTPVIEMHHEHPKYTSATPAHEAGFDSFLTAKIVIRLSAKLEAAGHYIDDYSFPDSDEEPYNTAPEGGGVLLQKTKLSSPPMIPQQKHGNKGRLQNGSDIKPQGASSNQKTVGGLPSDHDIRTEMMKPTQTPSQSRHQITFSHPTMFDLLGTMPLDEAETEGVGEGNERSTPTEVQPRLVAERTSPSSVFAMMPPWESDFWNVYGNKLRVNGTLEGICHLR